MENEVKKPFIAKKAHLYGDGVKENLLCPADRSRLIYIMLTRIKITEMKFIQPETLKKYSVIDEKETFIYWLQRNGLLNDLQPLHSKDRHGRTEKMFKVAMKAWLVPTDMVRKYYGDHVAIYFEWMNHLLKWLGAAGLFGLVVTVLNHIFDFDMNSPFNVFYSAFIVIWSVLFVIKWKMRRTELKVKWDLYHMEQDEEDMRKQFVGIPEINPVTGRIEPQYSSYRRSLNYMQSFIMCAPYFGIAFGAQIIFLNLTGIITPSHKQASWLIPQLADLAVEGAFFDVNSNMAILISIFQSVVVMILNKLFSQMAEKSTERENHRTQTAYNNSLILKRFVFEFCDFFLYLFYIAFAEMNMVLLRQSLVSLFIVDEIRRVVAESIVPYLTQNQAKVKANLKNMKSKVENQVKKQKGEAVTED
jgi:hypothetical protein